MKAICIGQATYDITLPVDKFPTENGKMKINKKIECGGGSASNAAYLLSSWGCDVYFSGVVGKDYYGSMILDEFDKVGVNKKYIQIKNDFDTPSSYIISNYNTSDRSIITVRNKSMNFIDDISIDDKFDVIYLDGYENNLAKKVIQNNPDAIKIIDAGGVKDGIIELCNMVDYIVCSKDFACEYTDVEINCEDLDSIIEAYKILNEKFSAKIIITLGEYGSFTYSDGYHLIPSIKVNAIDTTGAGDIYHAAFIYFMFHEYNILQSMRLANITAALSTEKIGSRDSIVLLEEVLRKNDDVLQ